jgi:thiamine-monophosphate kinase
MPLGEKSLIRRIRRMAAQGPTVITGIGDDSAVLRPPRHHDLLITTDFSLENIHFRRAWHPAEPVGWRCLTRGLSDIAAMGGTPHAAFLSLALPKNIPQRWVNGFLTGLLALAKLHNVPLAGGDTAQSAAGILADIVVFGSVPKGKAILRSGAKPGDHIYVTGELGASAAALDKLRRNQRLGVEAARHFHPQPRLEVGRWLRERNIPSAMIDISDGLSTDLHHICEESKVKVGALLHLAAIPRARVDSKYIDSKYVDLDYALHGGDDYELLFTSSRPVPHLIKGIPITRIGQITPVTKKPGKKNPGKKTPGKKTSDNTAASVARSIKTIDQHGRSRLLRPHGWEHFTSRR